LLKQRIGACDLLKGELLRDMRLVASAGEQTEHDFELLERRRLEPRSRTSRMMNAPGHHLHGPRAERADDHDGTPGLNGAKALTECEARAHVQHDVWARLRRRI
jgi:hypothetical protein